MALDKFFECVQCKEIPEEPPLYFCKKGHVICEFCFLESTFQNNKSCCPQCGKHVATKNIIGEKLFDPVYNSPMNTSEKSSRKSRSKNSVKHSTKSCCSTDGSSGLKSRRSNPLVSISKRPINCPNTSCSKMVAVTHLISHFQFDHSKIPQEYLEFNQPKSLVLSLNSMDYGKSHCVALLLVSSEKDSFSSSLSQTFNENGIAFPLMAARLSFKTETSNPVSYSAKKVEESEIYEDEIKDLSEIILIWICGNLESSIKCLIEVSDEKQTRIYSYYGSINSLREDNDPNAVFLRADCLLLHSSNVRKITLDGHYPMDLKVLISCPYDQLV